ncbi:MAG: Glycosyl transferase group 1 [Berkelbacteria bacterium GW2011_GWA2_38_9]|uniref:Glycosyl transferase group 1 n=1 Tax=Berkelbacteria bacterium GW2011_GWA2_38_9 TaxID=1618334 RepID=A0A0G0PJI7_9BACT|nr:MAG: Glycosyl transferase group 1 [Berkelbacteria bacterium GW2011_GWA2_38_9]
MKIGTITFSGSTYPPSPKKIIAPIRIAHDICEGMVDKQHDVYLFGPKDCQTRAKLISGEFSSFDTEPFTGSISQKDYLRVQKDLLLLTKVSDFLAIKKLDLLHAHEFRILPYFSPFFNCPVVHTYHGNPKQDILTPEDKQRMKLFYNYNFFVAVSEHQIRDGRGLFNFVGKVYHGIDVGQFTYSNKAGDYLLIANRIIHSKGVDLAIKAAIDVPYSQMHHLYQKAKAYLMPVRIDEAFGLVNIEAMACGTPVIAFAHGSIPEIIKDDVGFVIKNDEVSEMVKAIKNIDKISRQRCREYVEENFTIGKMVDGYEKVYAKVVKEWKKRK